MADSDRRRLIRRPFAAALGILVLAGISAIILYFDRNTPTGGMLCLSNMRIVSGKEVSENVTRFTDNIELQHPDLIARRIRGAPCCIIDKGGPEDRPLTFFDFILTGSRYYVHVPLERSGTYSGESDEFQDLIIPINSCGKPLRYGAF
jgi:hypothetical protein